MQRTIILATTLAYALSACGRQQETDSGLESTPTTAAATAAGWKAPLTLAAPAPSGTSSLTAAFNDGGLLFSVFVTPYTGAGDLVYFTADKTKSRFSLPSAPTVATTSAGHIVAVWTEQRGAQWNLMATQFTPNSGWGTATTVGTATTAQMNSANVAINDADQIVATWVTSTKDAAGNYVTATMAAFGHIGQAWGKPRLLSSGNDADYYQPCGTGLIETSNGDLIYAEGTVSFIAPQQTLRVLTMNHASGATSQVSTATNLKCTKTFYSSDRAYVQVGEGYGTSTAVKLLSYKDGAFATVFDDPDAKLFYNLGQASGPQPYFYVAENAISSVQWLEGQSIHHVASTLNNDAIKIHRIDADTMFGAYVGANKKVMIKTMKNGTWSNPIVLTTLADATMVSLFWSGTASKPSLTVCAMTFQGNDFWDRCSRYEQN